MNTEEFSTEWDVQVSAYYPGGVLFDEYEKSKFLTDAQEIIALQMYNNFEKKELAREIMAPLIRTATISEEYEGNDETGCEEQELYPISDMSYFYKLPEDLWLIVYEDIIASSKNRCIDGKKIVVHPTTHDKVSKTLENPFKRPNDNKALRINISDNVVELISKYGIKEYFVRYIKKLNPIILTKLTDSTSIKGETERTECELHESIHRDILNLAVQMALRSRSLLQNNQEQPQQEQVEN